MTLHGIKPAAIAMHAAGQLFPENAENAEPENMEDDIPEVSALLDEPGPNEIDEDAESVVSTEPAEQEYIRDPQVDWLEAGPS